MPNKKKVMNRSNNLGSIHSCWKRQRLYYCRHTDKLNRPKLIHHSHCWLPQHLRILKSKGSEYNIMKSFYCLRPCIPLQKWSSPHRSSNLLWDKSKLYCCALVLRNRDRKGHIENKRNYHCSKCVCGSHKSSKKS